MNSSKRSKRALLGAVGVSCALLLSACGDDSSSNSATGGSAASGGGEVEGRAVKVAFSAPAADHGWTAAVTTTAKAQAEKLGGDNVEFIAPGGVADAAQQVDQVKSLIAQKPDVLVILPVDGDALTPVALEAMKAGIPVINVDRDFSDLNASRSFITGDNYGAGFQAGQYFAKELNCKGNVVQIQGLAGISVTTDRTKGFVDGIAACNGGIKIVATQPADFDPAKGQTVMENILSANPAGSIDAVYTHDDDMAQGVVQAINQANRQGEMFLTGVGGSKAAFDQIKAGGLYRATFIYNPAMTGAAVNMAHLIGTGKGFSDLPGFPDVPKEIVMQASLVTKTNVDQYYSLGF